MRVVGGKVRGRRLAPCKASGTRPTSDKVREAIFNVLGQDLSGEKVLDIFAGTGALGIEALSRGAVSAAFIDNSKEAIKVIKKNLSLCDFELSGRIIMREAAPALSYLKGRREGAAKRPECYDLIFIDAPYAEQELTETTLETLADSGL